MEEKEPNWYRRLGTGPLRPEPHPTEKQLKAIVDGVMARPGRARRLRSVIPAIAAALALCAVVLLMMRIYPLPGGSLPPATVSGAAALDSIPLPADTTLLQVYRGAKEHWAAVDISYKVNGTDRVRSVLYLAYKGERPAPTGEMRYDYELGSGKAGSGSATFAAQPEAGIYYLGTFPDEVVPDAESANVKLNVVWDRGGRSEFLELKPDK